MEIGEMKRNTSNWSNFCILLSRAGLSASAGLSCYRSDDPTNSVKAKEVKSYTTSLVKALKEGG